MSYAVTDAEKAQAEKAVLAFVYTQKLLKMASDHLQIMLTPFKDHPDIDEKQVNKFRAALRRFRDKAIENFNEFKIAAFKCISLVQMFSTDTQTVKIMKSFIASIEDIEKQVNDFSELFSDLGSKTFVKDSVSAMEAIQKECEELNDIIDERVKSHFQTNIIGKSWVDSISNDLQMKLEKETPLMVDLYTQRQEQLNDMNKKKE